VAVACTGCDACVPLDGFRWKVDPALVLMASYLYGNEAVGSTMAGPVRAVKAGRVVDAGGDDEQEGALCLSEFRLDAGGVEQAGGDVQCFAEVPSARTRRPLLTPIRRGVETPGSPAPNLGTGTAGRPAACT
jgi:hypothetical protein